MLRRISLLVTAALVLVMMVSATMAGPAAADKVPPKPVCPPGGQPNDQINVPEQRTDWDAICHRTGSATNPYVIIEPNCTAVREAGPGHLPHNTPAGPGVDIDLPEEECDPPA
jgi:hypothetical protein